MSLNFLLSSNNSTYIRKQSLHEYSLESRHCDKSNIVDPPTSYDVESNYEEEPLKEGIQMKEVENERVEKNIKSILLSPPLSPPPPIGIAALKGIHLKNQENLTNDHSSITTTLQERLKEIETKSNHQTFQLNRIQTKFQELPNIMEEHDK
jgi:hypothetical protein